MIGILSDAHGNSYAFRTAIRLLKESLKADRFVFLGDSVGYIPSAQVLDKLYELRDSFRCVMGNHEKMLLDGQPDPQREVIYQLDPLRSSISDDIFRFIQTWPTHVEEVHAGKKVLYVHGSPHDFTNGYVYPDSDFTGINVDQALVFMGHSHYPFIRVEGRTTFVNVGSCGLPRDDGRYGCFATLDTATGEVCVYRYDITGSRKEILSAEINIHESVRKVFDRRSMHLFGHILKEDAHYE